MSIQETTNSVENAVVPERESDMEGTVASEECVGRLDVMNGTEPQYDPRLIQVRQFTFDLFRREGLIRDVDLSNVSFDNVTFDECMIRLVFRLQHPSGYEPYVADIDKFLSTVLTEEERERYCSDHYDFGPWVFKPWDFSRLVQAQRLVLEMEPRAEEWMDKRLEDFSLSDCLGWFLGYLNWPNPTDELIRKHISDFLAANVTEADWAYYRYDINSDPLEYLDPPEDGYLDDTADDTHPPQPAGVRIANDGNVKEGGIEST